MLNLTVKTDHGGKVCDQRINKLMVFIRKWNRVKFSGMVCVHSNRLQAGLTNSCTMELETFERNVRFQG